MVTIALDCMGGDHGVTVTIPASIDFLHKQSHSKLIWVGDAAALEAAKGKLDSNLRDRVAVQAASQIVAMDEAPAAALRSKRESSMRLAIEKVKSGEAQACVSAGNTGALMAMSRFVLKTLNGIDRPAIATQLPNQFGGSTVMLDLGANVDTEAEHLLQFAMMGSALYSALNHPENEALPRVGLLNIGEEAIKGNEVVKRAGDLLRASSLHFVGNVEGNDIYKNVANVIVCDGFVGNVALKTSEGLAQMIALFLREEFSKSWLSKLSALLASSVLRRFKDRVDHRRYNGASLIGLRGVVVKSHGSADRVAFQYALEHAFNAVQNRLLHRIESILVESNNLVSRPSMTSE